MEAWIEYLGSSHGGWELLVVFCAAGLEYILPPLPADSVVLAASLLVIAGTRPFFVVYLVAVLGGVCGSWVHFMLGRWVGRARSDVGHKIIARVLGGDAVDRFIARFRKSGMWVVALNRGLPGVRAVTFVAAGVAGLPLGRTLFFGLLSNMVWTFILLYAGVVVGGKWEKIEAGFSVYHSVVYIAVGVCAVAYIVYRLIVRRRRDGVIQAAAPSKKERQ